MSIKVEDRLCHDDRYGKHQRIQVFREKEIFPDESYYITEERSDFMQQRSLFYKQMPPGEVFPAVPITQIAFHLVGLALEIRIVVGFHPVATLDVAPQPFDAIQHLALLQSMDVFVVFLHLAHLSLVASGKDDAENVGGIETAEREIFIVDDLHPVQEYYPGSGSVNSNGFQSGSNFSSFATRARMICFDSSLLP